MIRKNYSVNSVANYSSYLTKFRYTGSICGSSFFINKMQEVISLFDNDICCLNQYLIHKKLEDLNEIMQLLDLENDE